MTDLSIREATHADLPAMAEIVVAWEQSTPWMNPTYSAEQIAGMFGEAFEDRILLVAGAPAQAYLAFDPQRNRIGGLYSSVTGGGVGKALMDKIKEGRDYLWLNTHEPNLAAQKFYKREGFVEISNEGAETTNDVPELRMEWRR
ncbi:GNAT family N-acetyltransferase [Planktotalea sp.]|uniref:GNAT family N-acetyltransferase n=1 Tax=Planktotalea sp. TaxID=2029877 RepID=UPI0032977D4B